MSTPREDQSSPSSLRVAIQGDVGSFSEQAAARQWPGGATLIRCGAFEEAIAEVLRGTVDRALIPVENAIAGPVEEALVALEAAKSQLQIEAEVRIPVQLCLLGVAGAAPAGVQEVHSHPLALAQCQRFFATHTWMRPVARPDTAAAARDVARRGDPAVGAIAAVTAARAFGLDVLATSVQDLADNWTRFVVVRCSGASDCGEPPGHVPG
jgi:prephenate dehydratase